MLRERGKEQKAEQMRVRGSNPGGDEQRGNLTGGLLESLQESSPSLPLISEARGRMTEGKRFFLCTLSSDITRSHARVAVYLVASLHSVP